MPTEIQSTAAERRRQEAIEITREAEAERERVCPIPVTGLSTAVEMLREHDQSGMPQLRAVQRSDDWQRLDSAERSVVAEWVRLRLPRSSPWLPAVMAILGSSDRRGRWTDPPAARVEHDPLSPEEWVEMHHQPDVAELVPTAPGLAYRGRAVVVHSPRGTGKTVYAAWLVCCALQDGLRVVLIPDDDPVTYARRLRTWKAPIGRLCPRRMADVAPAGQLEEVVEMADADLVVIDSWRRWSRACGATGRGALNDESLVGPVADRLVNVAAAGTGPAVVILTNEPKSPDNTTARGSVSLEDSMDGAVKRLTRSGDVTEVRESGKVREGLPRHPVQMRLTDQGFFPVDHRLEDGAAESNDETRLRDYLTAHPHASQRAVCRHMEWRQGGRGWPARRERIEATRRLLGSGDSAALPLGVESRNHCDAESAESVMESGVESPGISDSTSKGITRPESPDGDSAESPDDGRIPFPIELIENPEFLDDLPRGEIVRLVPTPDTPGYVFECSPPTDDWWRFVNRRAA